LRRRGSQVVRHGSAKAAFVGSIPTLASSFKLLEKRRITRNDRFTVSESVSEKSDSKLLRLNS
jgi:hypothetical protein